MWELSVERACTHDELVTAAARALGIDRERIQLEARAWPGDFALRVTLHGVEGDPIPFYRAFAAALACKLLVDDGDINPYTDLLVTPDGSMVRVNLDADALDRDDEAIVITGLYQHVDNDDPPDPTAHAPEPPAHRKRYLRTRGEELSHIVNDYMIEALPAAPLDQDAFYALYTPEVQDAEHALTEVLRDLVDRKSMADDERAMRRHLATLQRAFPDPRMAGFFIPTIMRTAETILANLPWDPEAAG